MARPYTEQQVLKKLDISDFRHLTKEKVIAFATMVPKMNPEVAKKALEQFPNFASTSLDVLKESTAASSRKRWKTIERVCAVVTICITA